MLPMVLQAINKSSDRVAMGMAQLGLSGHVGQDSADCFNKFGKFAKYG